MRKRIDCLLIGHNDSELARKVNMNLIIRNKDKFNFEDVKHICIENKEYTVSQMLSLYFDQEKTYSKKHDFNSDKYLNGAIQYIGSLLYSNGITFDYINSYNLNKEQLIQMLTENTVKCVVITTTFYTSYTPIIEVVREIRKYNKDTKIIVGGPYISNVNRKYTPENNEKTLKMIGADIYIFEDGVMDTLIEITKRIKNDESYLDMSNIAYKENNNIIYNEIDSHMKEIKDGYFELHWEPFCMDEFKSVIIKTSDSCPFHCAFCENPQRLGKYKAYSLEFVERELDKINQLSSIKSIRFADDTFNVPKERFKAILRLIIKKKYKFKWASYIRCQFLDEEAVQLMVESGCQAVFLGIESGNQIVLNNMNKRVNLPDYEKGIALLRKYNIPQVASFIVGFPGETDQSVEDTIHFIEQIKPTFFHVWVWYYSEFTDISMNSEKYGLTGRGVDWVHNTMTSKEAFAHKNNIVNTIQNSTFLPVCFEDMLCLLNYGIGVEAIKEFSLKLNDIVNLSTDNHTKEEIYGILDSILLKERKL